MKNIILYSKIHIF